MVAPEVSAEDKYTTLLPAKLLVKETLTVKDSDAPELLIAVGLTVHWPLLALPLVGMPIRSDPLSFTKYIPWYGPWVTYAM